MRGNNSCCHLLSHTILTNIYWSFSGADSLTRQTQVQEITSVCQGPGIVHFTWLTGTSKWKRVIINVITYTCVFPAIISQKVPCEKGRFRAETTSMSSSTPAGLQAAPPSLSFDIFTVWYYVKKLSYCAFLLRLPSKTCEHPCTLSSVSKWKYGSKYLP